MSRPHLRALEAALARKGWRVVAIHPGNDYDITVTWEVRRSASEPSLFIDFYGLRLDGDGCLPLEESYACTLRGRSSVDLYFRRVNKSRELWQQDVAQFVRALDDAGAAPGTSSGGDAAVT
jgi:hypothetical protein